MSDTEKNRKRFEFKLDLRSGVPVYRQIIDLVLGGIASGALRPGDQLPTVRHLAVTLAVNPNTVVRAYRELEIREVLETQQGTGTFVTDKKPKTDDVERRRRMAQMVGELMARAGSQGITLRELRDYFNELWDDQERSA